MENPMSEFVYLEGTEPVAQAARNMVGAAEIMSRTAADLEFTLQRHREFMDDWLQRLEDAITNQKVNVAEQP